MPVHVRACARQSKIVAQGSATVECNKPGWALGLSKLYLGHMQMGGV